MDDTIFDGLKKEDIASILESLPEVDAQVEPLSDFVLGVSEIAQDDISTVVNDNLPTVQQNATGATPGLPAMVQDDTDTDFEIARKNLKDIADHGNDIVKDLILLAKQSDQPRAYEVLANTINILAGINKDIVDIHSKRADAKKKQGAPTVVNTTNIQNNVVLTTAELQKLLKQK